jgi:hypothetical protein
MRGKISIIQLVIPVWSVIPPALGLAMSATLLRTVQIFKESSGPGSDFASMRSIQTNYDQREDQVSGPPFGVSFSIHLGYKFFNLIDLCRLRVVISGNWLGNISGIFIRAR